MDMDSIFFFKNDMDSINDNKKKSKHIILRTIFFYRTR